MVVNTGACDAHACIHIARERRTALNWAQAATSGTAAGERPGTGGLATKGSVLGLEEGDFAGYGLKGGQSGILGGEGGIFGCNLGASDNKLN